MNSVLLTGTLARDPMVRATNNGKMVASFTVLSVRTWTANGQNYTGKDYVQCVAWGNAAQKVGNLKANASIEVKGRIGTRSYEDKSGQKKWVTEVNVEEVETPGTPTQNTAPQGFNNGSNFNVGQFAGRDQGIPF